MSCGSVTNTSVTNDKEFQYLDGWQSHTLESLLDRFKENIDNEEVRVYTVASTWLDKRVEKIRHKGSGPNLEGGLATLCTCKRSMRQGRPSDYWPGKWILGVTSRAKSHGFSGDHYLLYLMQVEKVFDSHKDLYQHLKQNNSQALKIKNTVTNTLGDVFEPITNCTNPLDPKFYRHPHQNHSHVGEDEWKLDISYETPDEKRLPTPLLLGNFSKTFVWQKPMIKFNQDRGSGNKMMTMRELLSELS